MEAAAYPPIAFILAAKRRPRIIPLQFLPCLPSRQPSSLPSHLTLASLSLARLRQIIHGLAATAIMSMSTTETWERNPLKNHL